uniref:Nucleotide-diphospho-sugar transferase domain-containing protein n=1 Tax=Arcella intermedia TaxID=1963864 RepID=A0A6B2KZP7_9EUKA
MTFSNYGYLDMLLNWIYNITALKITNYVIAALDRLTYEALEKLGVESFFYDKDEMVKFYDAKECNFNSVEFMSICNEKPFLVNEILKGGFDCLWTDTDIIFFKNPLPVFDEQIADFQFQSDDDDICAGFFYAKSNPRTIRFLNAVVAHTRQVVVLDDQSIMRLYLHDPNYAVRMVGDVENVSFEQRNSDFLMKVDKMNVKHQSAHPAPSQDSLVACYYTLDRVRFPNGTAYFNAKLPQKLGIIPHIVHNNCIIGHTGKVDRFKLYNMWFIGENNDTTWLNPPQPPKLALFSPIRILKGHIEVISTLAIRGTALISSGYDKQLRHWDISNGLQLLDTHYLNKRGGAWSIKFWDFSNSDKQFSSFIEKEANKPQPQTDHSKLLQSLGVAQTNKVGEVLFTGGHDKKIFAWEVKGWKKIMEYKGHIGIVNSIFLHDYKGQLTLLSGSDDGDIRSWNIFTGEKIKIYRGHTSWVSALIASGPIMYSASHDGTAMAWEISTGRILQIYKGHNSWVRTLALHNDTLYTAAADGKIKAWAVRSGDCLATLEGHTGGINDIIIRQDILYSASDDKTVRAWDLKENKPIAIYQGHTGIISSLESDNHHLYTASYDRLIMQWPLSTTTQ